MIAQVSGPAANGLKLPDQDPFTNLKTFGVIDSQAKAWNLIDPQGKEVSASTNYEAIIHNFFGYVSFIIHEIGHAMGRIINQRGIYSNVGGALNFFDYYAQGELFASHLGTQISDRPDFSIDGGKTNLRNYLNADYSDFDDINNTAPFNSPEDTYDYEGYTRRGAPLLLSPLDLILNGAMGYKLSDFALTSIQQAADASPESWGKLLHSIGWSHA